MRYTDKGTCSMAIEYELDDEQRVRNVNLSVAALEIPRV